MGLKYLSYCKKGNFIIPGEDGFKNTDKLAARSIEPVQVLGTSTNLSVKGAYSNGTSSITEYRIIDYTPYHRVLKYLESPDLIFRFFNTQLPEEDHIDSFSKIECRRIILESDNRMDFVFYEFTHIDCDYAYLLSDHDASEIVKATDYLATVELNKKPIDFNI